MTTTRAERSTVVTLYAGLVLTVVAAVVPFIDRTLLADHVRAGYPTFTQDRIDAAVAAWLAILAVVGALGALCWLAAIWAVRAGKRWARWGATALFAIGTTIALTLLLIKDSSGDTGLPPLLGWMWIIPCLAGLLAVTSLWRRWLWRR